MKLGVDTIQNSLADRPATLWQFMGPEQSYNAQTAAVQCDPIAA